MTPWGYMIGFHLRNVEVFTTIRTNALLSFIRLSFHVIRKSTNAEMTLIP